MVGVNRQLIAFEWVSEQKIEPHVQEDGQCAVDRTVVPRYRNMKVSDFWKRTRVVPRPLVPYGRGVFLFFK